MKAIIKKILRKAGWEVNRVENISALKRSNRSTIKEGLKWLADHGFHIETVLDVGASNGCWSKICMNFFPEANYILFEPQPFHSDAIDAFANSCKQTVIPVKKAVGGSQGSVFFDVSNPFGGSLVKKQRDKTIEVELTTIDATMSQLQMKEPYLIKLDTHGFEQEILQGSSKVLNKTEALIIEAYNYNIKNEALLFWELCAFLYERGFRPIDLVDVMYREYDNSLWQMDLVFIRSTWEGFKKTSYK